MNKKKLLALLSSLPMFKEFLSTIESSETKEEDLNTLTSSLKELEVPVNIASLSTEAVINCGVEDTSLFESWNEVISSLGLSEEDTLKLSLIAYTSGGGKLASSTETWGTKFGLTNHFTDIQYTSGDEDLAILKKIQNSIANDLDTIIVNKVVTQDNEVLFSREETIEISSITDPKNFSDTIELSAADLVNYIENPTLPTAKNYYAAAIVGLLRNNEVTKEKVEDYAKKYGIFSSTHLDSIFSNHQDVNQDDNADGGSDDEESTKVENESDTSNNGEVASTNNTNEAIAATRRLNTFRNLAGRRTGKKRN